MRLEVKDYLLSLKCEFRKNGAVIPRQRSDRSA